MERVVDKVVDKTKCAKCLERPRYVDNNNHIHDFCSRTCAQNASLYSDKCIGCGRLPLCYGFPKKDHCLQCQ